MEALAIIAGILTGAAAFTGIVLLLARFLASRRAYKDTLDREIDKEFERHCYPKKTAEITPPPAPPARHIDKNTPKL